MRVLGPWRMWTALRTEDHDGACPSWCRAQLAFAPVTENLEFALLGNPTLPLTDQLPDAEWAKPYGDRPRVNVAVEPNATLGRATEMAVMALRELHPGDYTYAGVFFAFHSNYDEHGMANRWGRISTTVTLITERGSAVWNQPARAATVRDLLAAKEADALLGDPRKPYVVLNPPMGNGVLGSWDDVARAWTVFWQVLEQLDVVGGVAGLAVLVRDEVRRRAASRMASLLRRLGPGWQERRGAAHDIGSFLNEKPRSTQSLSRLLDVSSEDAETLLLGRGFSQDSSGLWVPAEDEAGALLHRVAAHLDWTERVDQPKHIVERLGRIAEGHDPYSR